MTTRRRTAVCCALGILTTGGAFLGSALAQSRSGGSAYARLQITGNDAVLLMEGRIVRFEGPASREDLPVENSKGLRAFEPLVVIHLNNAAQMGYEVVGSATPDAEAFLLRRR